MKEIKASELIQGVFFTLSTRKNARLFQATIVEIVTGEKWQGLIDRRYANEGDIFTMGNCQTKFGVQQFLKPETTVWIK